MNFGPSSMIRDIEVPPKAGLLFFTIGMFAAFGVILGRLVELTVIHGAEYRQRADENRIFIRPLRALRGVFFDRHGTVLVRNVPITRTIDFPGDDLGLIDIEASARFYPTTSAFSHAVGYVGEIDESDLGKEPGDVVGKTGLERVYDDVLRGRDGSELVEVDANGKLLRVLGTEPAVDGRNVETTMDASLQETAFRALNGRKGAAIALDPKDGAVLALASSPSFDPNVFGRAGKNEQERMSRKEEIQRLLTDTVNRPLFNRAVSGEYPPGSIFKLVTASAGLSERSVTGDTTIEDTGEILIGEFRYGNWFFDQYGRTEGTLQLPRAIARSNDIFFYKVGEWVGPESLARWAKRLGLGEKTGIDTTGESDGLVPDPLWKERVFGERWFLGNTYHMAIGQGDVRVTPLQAAVMMAGVVTGRRCTPFIHSSHAFASTSTCQEVGLSDEHRALILQGMVGACSRGGTGFPFFEWNETGSPATVACKTGTAQHGGEKTKPHAWIVVAGPVKKCKDQTFVSKRSDRGSSECKDGNSEFELDRESEKRVVLVVLLEEAGEGSAEAAPVAKEILEGWFGSLQ